MIYTIIRQPSEPYGTFGSFYGPDGKQLCVTVEPPATGDHPCIPVGIYDCIPHNGDHWKNIWEITNVPGRTAILIHAGNLDTDTEGCVVVGATFGELGAQEGVLNSLNTLNMLRNTLPPSFILGIHNAEDNS